MVVGVKINPNDGFVQVVASGGQTDLDFDFPLYRKTDITIIRNRSGVITTLALTTDYNIPGASLSDEDGGTAVLTSGATAGDIYTLLLSVPEARVTDYIEAGDFGSNTLNLELDLQTQMIQQLRRDVDKSLRFADSSSTSGQDVPEPSDGLVLGWSGSTLANLTPNTDTYINISTFGETLIDDADAAAARTTLGLGGAAVAALIDSDTFTGATDSNVNSAEATKAYIDATKVGVTDGSDAAAGYIGEIIEATLASGSATSLVNGVSKNITSISLTAGDWDVWGSVAVILASTTQLFGSAGSISTVSNTNATPPNGGGYISWVHETTGPLVGPVTEVKPVGMKRVSISSTTTIYLVINAAFNTSTATAYGYIGARRVR